MSKVHARSHEITNKPLRVHTTKTLWLQTWKTNYNAEKCASDVQKAYLYPFILRYEAWVNLKLSSNKRKTNRFPAKFVREALTKSAFFTNRFSAKLTSKIPAKFPRNRPFFPRNCPWKSREIWFFFRDLPEALYCALGAATLNFRSVGEEDL